MPPFHGHTNADARNKALHQAAFTKLRDNSELLGKCLELLARWLHDPEQVACRPYLMQWHDLLTRRPIDKVAELVLNDTDGQTLRQCSPLGPALSPKERWAAFAAINSELQEAHQGGT